MAASSVSSNDPGDFVNSRQRMVKGLVRMIMSSGLALNLRSRPHFVQFMKAATPDFRKVKQRIVVREANKEYKSLKMVLNSTFASLNHKVALAFDVWRNESQLYFIRITAHWIDSDWKMQRRIINFKMLEFPIVAASISKPVLKSVNAWGIKGKTVSVTTDDDCDYAVATQDIKNVINPILDGKLFHVRCASRILNSCVLIGLNLKLVSRHLTKIRNGIARGVYYKELFVSLCKKHDLKSMLMLDDELRWDSTRDMLKNSMQYKDVLAEYFAMKWPRDNSNVINEKDWVVASIFCIFLDVFYEAVDYVTGNYYPTSCGILRHLVNIARLFSEHRKSTYFKQRISVMEEHFREHYERIPNLYCLAAVMDPRIKLSGCECLLESFYQCNDNKKVNLEEEKIGLCKLLQETYSLYASRSAKKADSEFDELSFYLQTPHDFQDETRDFDILEWWKAREAIYPVLSTMARDLLTTPVSTLAPESNFAVNEGKVIQYKSYHLRGRKLEIYSCLKDWFHAEERTQGERKPYDNYDEVMYLWSLRSDNYNCWRIVYVLCKVQECILP